ncbi:hypothetical protein [Peribacillus loiseleuriae]|uniref:hypothetical protein n=1 Tax=Peribacillus loiseleuriae TaxID=1679170 RepID=UPI003CFD36B2
MNNRLKPTLAIFLSLLSFAGFSLVAFFVRNQPIGAFDHTEISIIQGMILPTLTPLMLFWSYRQNADIIR